MTQGNGMGHVCPNVTPSAGERCHYGYIGPVSESPFRCKLNVGHDGEHQMEVVRVPTPSAGEEEMTVDDADAEAKRRYGLGDRPHDWSYAGEHPMGAHLGVWVYCKGYVHAPTFKEAFRLADQRVGVSAGETKCGLKGCTLTTPHTHGLERFVGARPEEKGCKCGGVFTGPNATHTKERCTDPLGPCTACACEKCKADRDFLRALADHWKGVAAIDQNIPPHNSFDRVTRAARKVVEESARRVTA